MDAYEMLLSEADKKRLTVREYPFTHHDGMIIRRKIGIRKTLATRAEKADVLAEEIAHWESTSGDILDQRDPLSLNRQQERRARFRAYNKRIGLQGIIDAWEYGCQNNYEAAEYLGTGQKFLEEALECYRQKYGICTECNGYTIIFEPTLLVIKNE